MPMNRRTQAARNNQQPPAAPQVPSTLGVRIVAAMEEEKRRERQEQEQAEREAYEEWRQGFRRAATGSIWRQTMASVGDDLVELTVSVFPNPNPNRAGWSWCCAGPGSAKRFSSATNRTEEEALGRLWQHVLALAMPLDPPC